MTIFDEKPDCIKRVDNIEFRWCVTNNSYELVRWYQPELKDKEYCVVICFFNKQSEGYDMTTVGNRYAHCLIEWADILVPVTVYASEYLKNEFTLEKHLKEL